MIELALSSRARLAIVPLQDVLGLGSEARMNTPGTATGNWSWRLEQRRAHGRARRAAARRAAEAAGRLPARPALAGVGSRSRRGPRRRRERAPGASPRARARAWSAAGGRGRARAAPARPAPREPWTSRQSSIVSASETSVTASGVTSALVGSGQSRSATSVTGSTSAAKFVPQRAAKRLGRAVARPGGPRRRSSTAAIARCSAPWRCSVRPRKSHPSRPTVAARSRQRG